MVAALALAGCGGEEEPAPVAPAPPPVKKPAPEPAPEEPKKPIKAVKVEDPLEQHLRLTLAEPIEFKDCYATLGRGVLQLSSYESNEPSKYPAVFIWSKVGADTPKALEGETFDAKVYVQMKKGETPLHTPDGRLLQLKITKVSDTMIAGELIAGELTEGVATGDETEERVPIKGTFGAEIK